MQDCHVVLLSYWNHGTLVLNNAFDISKHLNRQVIILQKEKNITREHITKTHYSSTAANEEISISRTPG